MSTKNFKSVNECVDMEASRHWYKQPELPLLSDVAEMVCQRRSVKRLRNCFMWSRSPLLATSR